MNNVLVGKNIKDARKKHGITQVQLGNLIKKSESTIRKYENGKIEVPASVLEEISKILKVTANSLTGWSSNYPNNIRVYRRMSGLSQTELAEKVGTSLKIIQKYEKGNIDPNDEINESISKILNVSMSKLLESGMNWGYRNNDIYGLDQIVYEFLTNNGYSFHYDETTKESMRHISFLRNNGEALVPIDDVINLNNLFKTFIKSFSTSILDEIFKKYPK